MKSKPKNKSFHYTNEKMAKELIKLTPICRDQSVLDAGSGNKIWFKNIPIKKKYECEIDNGSDFYKWIKKVDWIIGNPPFHESWKFTEKAIELAQTGIAWLVNNQALNSHFTPRRLELMKNKGFYLNKIHVVLDKRWFGRYYYLIFTKEPNDFLSWNKKTY
jgi:hypothetical protein